MSASRSTLGVVLTGLIVVTVFLAGCLGGVGPDDLGPTTDGDPDADLKPREEPLWDVGQTVPHPAWNFPTLTNPIPNASEKGLPAWWEPIDGREVPAAVSGVEHVADSGDDATAGAGIAIFGRLAIVPTWQGPTMVFDISDPADPVKLGELDDAARDADTIAYPMEGRLVVVLATDSGVVPVWDVTDPEDPTRLGQLEPTTGSHNVAVVPGTPILYNAGSDGGHHLPSMATGVTEIYNLTWERLMEGAADDDLGSATHVADWQNGYSCHDVTFFIDPPGETFRAYCAGIEATQIWDVADPLSPEVVVNVPVHHGNPALPSASIPLVHFSHLAMVNDDASVLIVGDETGGGAAPACDAYVDGQVQTLSGPLGNVYFYDISDEQDPQLMSFMSTNHHYPTNPPGDDEGGFGAAGCTAHFGRLVPQEDRDMLALAFYGAGVTLIDFTDPAHPVIVDQWNDNTNTWDVWYYSGYLFTGDLSRGMDVFELTG